MLKVEEPKHTMMQTMPKMWSEVLNGSFQWAPSDKVDTSGIRQLWVSTLYLPSRVYSSCLHEFTAYSWVIQFIQAESSVSIFWFLMQLRFANRHREVGSAGKVFPHTRGPEFCPHVKEAQHGGMHLESHCLGSKIQTNSWAHWPAILDISMSPTSFVLGNDPWGWPLAFLWMHIFVHTCLKIF